MSGLFLYVILNFVIVILKKRKDFSIYILVNLGYISIIPYRVKADFDFSNFKNIIAVHGEFLLSYSGEHLSPVYNGKALYEDDPRIEYLYNI